MNWNPLTWLKKLFQPVASVVDALREKRDRIEQETFELSLRVIRSVAADADILEFAKSQKLGISLDRNWRGDDTARFDAASNAVLVNPARASDSEGLRDALRSWHNSWVIEKMIAWENVTPEERAARLATIKNVIRRAPLTLGLLEMAEELKVDIRFAPELIGSAIGAQVSTEQNAILVNPFSLGPLDEFVGLVHELRHVWQLQQLGLTHEKYEAMTKSNSLTHILIVRVMEADAYAFGDLFMQHMFDLQKDIDTETGADKKRPLTLLEQFNVVSKTDRRKWAEYKDLLHDHFLARLTTLDAYDVWTLRYSFQKYAGDQKGGATPVEDTVALGDLKKMLKVGFDSFDPEYMSGLSDLRFGATVLQDMQPGLRQTLRLMKKFDCVVKNDPVADTRQLRTKIENTLVTALLDRPITTKMAA